MKREDGPPTRILVATRNGHKLEEIRGLLADLPLRVLSPDDLELAESAAERDVESWETFEGNAIAKARYFRRITGLPTLADDSGLRVDPLGGAPGVRSRRYAPAPGPDPDAANNAHLLEALRGVPDHERTAHYACAMAFLSAPVSVVVTGRVYGRIGRDPRGSGGFGYDPLFILADGDRTYAELDPSVKAETSHRARAVAALRPWLAGLA
ncbi:MAG: non-canonical purine NTP pyrophosphatase [Gemmatimonadota bacterium]